MPSGGVYRYAKLGKRGTQVPRFFLANCLKYPLNGVRIVRAILLLLGAVYASSVSLAIDPPPVAMKLIEEFKAKEKAAKKKLEAEIAALRAKANKETEENKKALVVELQRVRATLEKEEKHNEARAVAARIRSITSPVPRAVDAPANMTGYVANAANLDNPFIFRVVGRLEGGTVWGSGPYTSDSDICKAAVHAGMVGNGEPGLIKVTLISTAGIDFAGSNQNGVVTSAYTAWPNGYRIERVTSEEAEGAIEAEDPLEEESAEPLPSTGAPSPPPGGAPIKLESLSPRSSFVPLPK